MNGWPPPPSSYVLAIEGPSWRIYEVRDYPVSDGMKKAYAFLIGVPVHLDGGTFIWASRDERAREFAKFHQMSGGFCIDAEMIAATIYTREKAALVAEQLATCSPDHMALVIKLIQ